MPAKMTATGFRPARWLFLILAGFGVAGCSNLGEPLEGTVPERQVQRGRLTPAQAITQADADKQLLAFGTRYRRVSDVDTERGCEIKDGVELTEIAGVQLTRPALLTQDMAIRLGKWLTTSVQPEVQKQFGTQLAALDVGGSYACRNIYGKPFGGRFAGRLSEHAFANALDIGGFKLADGRSIEFLKHWHAKDGSREFLQTASLSACEVFNTTLTPDYDRFHRNHIHIDASPKKEEAGKFCGVKGRFSPGAVPAFARYKQPIKKVKHPVKKRVKKKPAAEA